MTIIELCKKYKIPTIKKHPQQKNYDYNLSLFEIESNVATLRTRIKNGVYYNLSDLIGNKDGWFTVAGIKEAVALHIFYKVYLDEHWEKLIPYIIHALELQLLFDSENELEWYPPEYYDNN